MCLLGTTTSITLSSPSSHFSAILCACSGSTGSDGGWHLVPRIERLVGPPVPTGAAAGTSQIQSLEHQPKFAGVNLDVPPPYRRLRGECERSALEPLVQEQIAGPVPHEEFDPVLAPVDEAEDMAAQRRLADDATGRRCQTVEPTSEV